MKISKSDLEWAAGQGVLSPEQAAELWKRLEERHAQQPHFSADHVAYYFGAMIVISAMGWFMTLAWETLGGLGIAVIAALYALCFTLAGKTLWRQTGLQIPGGLLFTIAVCMTPLIVYGLEKAVGFWPQDTPSSFRDYHVYVKGSWIMMELATVLVAVVFLRFFPFPFLTAPIAFSLWYLSMDLTPILFGVQDFSWDERKWVSVWFGLVMLLAAFLADRRTGADYSFWGYLFGLLAFWGGLSLMDDGSEWGKFCYGLINVGLMVVSVLLERRVFIVFGALGFFGYLGHLSYHVFENSLFFPFALTILGVGVIVFGIQFQKHGERIQQALLARLPRGFVRHLPRERSRPGAAPEGGTS
ncbi:MAG: DUF2157 domain-containing protein [Proteobacteria bacterium]|nr:DUF2157 domain-containing protein [Pseudomonadota bacterium]